MHLRRPDRPRLDPIPAIAERAAARMGDSPANAINVLATLAHNKGVSKGIGALAGWLLSNGTVPPRLRELVILRMGWNCQAVYEFGQHTLFGRSVGLTEAELYLVTRPIAEGGWTPVESALLQMTDDLYADDCVSDATWAQLTEHLTGSDIVEYVAAAGCYRMVSGLLNSCGVQLDEGVPGWPTRP